ncbi:MAG TPA: hypothetical protein VFW29_02235 [Solirubrobacteraceae bacterium]|nr:hypothetical protein [Solirubrobacteraceae bacterium]
MARSEAARPAGGPAADKQQFNVYLPPALIRRAKHTAIDHATSLSRMVELALSHHLDRLEASGGAGAENDDREEDGG